MSNRYCGRARLSCYFDDATDQYDCDVYVGDVRRGTIHVGLPGAWATLPEYRNGVDSDEAYDSAARAAVSFALCDDPDDSDVEAMLSEDEVDYDENLEGPHITRRRPRNDSQTSLPFKGRR